MILHGFFASIFAQVDLTQIDAGNVVDAVERFSSLPEAIPVEYRTLTPQTESISNKLHDSKSGRRRDCFRRPPTPPDIRFR